MNTSSKRSVVKATHPTGRSAPTDRSVGGEPPLPRQGL